MIYFVYGFFRVYDLIRDKYYIRVELFIDVSFITTTIIVNT